MLFLDMDYMIQFLDERRKTCCFDLYNDVSVEGNCYKLLMSDRDCGKAKSIYQAYYSGATYVPSNSLTCRLSW